MPIGKWSASSDNGATDFQPPHTIAAINALPLEVKLAVYASLVPDDLVERFHLDLSPDNPHLGEFFHLFGDPGSPTAEFSLYHQPGFPDPVMHGQITDTANGPLEVLFFVMNDPHSPRFDVDRMPDGTPTQLGTNQRNLQAEIAAMQAGLAPGQVRRGLQLFSEAALELERFVAALGHEIFFVQPLYYHNAIIFENYGFAYARGRRLMERIQLGFQPDGEFIHRLDGSTPFRNPQAANGIRARSWALHDGLLEEHFTNVSMYKQVGQSANLTTCPGCGW